MLGSSSHSCSSEQPRASSLVPNNRSQKKNHTSKLQELALLLPVPLKTGSKKLTKKDILLHALQYIQYLQRSISVAKALLKRHVSSEGCGLGELQTRPQIPHCSLALDKHELVLIPSDQKEYMGETTTPPRCPDPCDPRMAALCSSQEENGDEEGGRIQPTLLDVAENIVLDDVTSCCYVNSTQDGEPAPALEAQSQDEMICFLDETPFWPSVTGHPSEILGLSPSLFTSSGKLLPEQILEDGTEYLTQGLFEEVLLEPESLLSAGVFEAPQKDIPSWVPEGLPESSSLCQSTVPLDHCYLSLNENNQVQASSISEDTGSESVFLWEQEEANPEDLQSSSSEDDDYTWTLTAAGRKARKGRAGRDLGELKGNKKAHCSTQAKKKCVNGFIMFCRMNRRPYIRACPGTASTAATKELAQLWRMMSQREQRPYCIKARRFSRQDNRIMKHSSSSEDEDLTTLKPLCQLLAEKEGPSCPRPVLAVPLSRVTARDDSCSSWAPVLAAEDT
ncbi:meiosis initiator protein [Ctenodactylus gundi]